jgi:hypothetical protein
MAASLQELEAAFIKADDAAAKGDKSAADDAAAFAAEIKRMRGSSAAPAPVEQPRVSPATRPPPSGMTPELMRAAATAGGQVGVPLTSEAAAGYLRGAPVAAMMAFPPTSLIGMAGMGLIGGAAEIGARGIEGKAMSDGKSVGEAAKVFLQMALPPGRIGAAGSMLASAGQAAKMGGVAYGTTVGADVVGKVIAEQDFPTWKSMADSMKGAKSAGILGGAMGMFGSRLSGLAKSSEEAVKAAEGRRALYEAIGAENPTLAQLMPSMSAVEARVVSAGGKLGKKISEQQLQVGSDITKAFLELKGDTPDNSRIASAINPLIPQVDEAEKAYVAASQKAFQARERLAAAEANIALDPATKQAIHAQATAEQLTAVNEKAVALFKANAAVGDIASNTDRARELSKVVGDLFKARSEAYRAIFRESGINDTAPLFDRYAMSVAAEAAMGSGAKSVAGKSILSAIRGSDDEMAAMAEAIAAGKEPPRMSLVQFRDLREDISNRFAGAQEGYADNAERLAGVAYKAAGDVAASDIATQLGSDALAAYNRARGYWAETSKLRDSRFGRDLLRTDVADNAVEQLANGVASGNLDQIRNFKEFVDAVGSQSPGVGEVAMQTLAMATKNALVRKYTRGGEVQYDKVLDALGNASTLKALPFPIESFGFGSRETIQQWRSALQTFKPEDVKPGVVESVLQNPMVKRAVETGGSDTRKVIEKATAEELFNRKVFEQALLKEANAESKARKVADEANRLAMRAGLDAADAEVRLATTMKDPALAAFRGRGGYTISNENSSDSVKKLISSMSPDTAKVLIGTLRERNPNVADMVERRLVADTLDKFFKTDPKTPGSSVRLDMDAVRAFFEVPDNLKAGSELALLERTIGAEKMGNLKKFVSSLSRAQDDMRRARLPQGKPHDDFLTGASMAAQTAPRGGTGTLAIGRRLLDLADKKAYHTMALRITDPKRAADLLDNSKSVQEVIASYPAAKAYLLLADDRLAGELADVASLARTKLKFATPPEEQPTAVPPKKSAYQEGKVYRDPETGERRRYRKGQFVEIT